VPFAQPELMEHAWSTLLGWNQVLIGAIVYICFDTR